MPDNREIPNGDPRIDQIQRALQQIAADIGDLRSALPASEQRIFDRTQELIRDAVQNSGLHFTKLVRDTEITLLNSFSHQRIQFQRLAADSSTSSRAGELRIDNLEQRILELERRVLRRRDDDSAPLPS